MKLLIYSFFSIFYHRLSQIIERTNVLLKMLDTLGFMNFCILIAPNTIVFFSFMHHIIRYILNKLVNTFFISVIIQYFSFKIC